MSAASEAIARDQAGFDAIALRLHELANAFDDKTKTARAITPDMRMGNASFMGGGSLMGARIKQESDPSAVPAEHLFHLMLETCTSCHSEYRLRK